MEEWVNEYCFIWQHVCVSEGKGSNSLHNSEFVALCFVDSSSMVSQLNHFQWLLIGR